MPTSQISATSLTVGSSDDSDVVIKQPTVSKVHCRFDWKNDLWVLTDLGSTNGTFVNGTRITQPTALSPADRVTLGRGIDCKIPQPPRRDAPQPAAISPSSNNSNKPAFPITLWALGGVASIAVIGLIIVTIFSQGRSKQEVLETGKSISSSTAAPTSPSNDAVANQSTVPKGEATKVESNPQAALWAAVVESSDGKTQKLLGTAIAIDSKRLVTLASLAHVTEVVKDEFPRVRLINLINPKLTIVPTKLTIHPNYLKAVEAFATMESELNEKLKTLSSLDEPPLEDKLKWSERFETVMEAIALSDLAIIESPEALSDKLAISQSSESSDCRLLGFPLVAPSPEVSSNLRAFSIEVLGQVRSPNELGKRAKQVDTVGLTAVSTVSLACVDAQNQLLGIVTRQANAEDNSLQRISEVIPVKLFD